MTADAPRLTSLPNLLGLSRIAATPVVIVLLLLAFPGSGLLAFVVFAVAAATDFVDGRIARARGLVSPVGVFLDLTADKVLVAGVLIAMVEVELLPTWMVALLLIRELVVQGVRQVAASAAVVMPSRLLGKGKTMATLLGMALLLLARDAASGGPLVGSGAGDALRAAGYWTMVVATALSVVSGWEYVRSALPVLSGRPPGGPRRLLDQTPLHLLHGDGQADGGEGQKVGNVEEHRGLDDPCGQAAEEMHAAVEGERLDDPAQRLGVDRQREEDPAEQEHRHHDQAHRQVEILHGPHEGGGRQPGGAEGRAQQNRAGDHQQHPPREDEAHGEQHADEGGGVQRAAEE